MQKKGYMAFKNIHANLPGGRTGIPKWVMYQSEGCEVRIDLLEKWYIDDNFLV